MGVEKIYLQDKDDIDYSVERINETIENLDEIYQDEKEIDEYCLNNPWTYSGT